jgi:hypothetical protein
MTGPVREGQGAEIGPAHAETAAERFRRGLGDEVTETEYADPAFVRGVLAFAGDALEFDENILHDFSRRFVKADVRQSCLDACRSAKHSELTGKRRQVEALAASRLVAGVALATMDRKERRECR